MRKLLPPLGWTLGNLALQISGYQSPRLAAVLVAGMVLSWAWWLISHDVFLNWCRGRKNMTLFLAVVIGGTIGSGAGGVWWAWQIRPKSPGEQPSKQRQIPDTETHGTTDKVEAKVQHHGTEDTATARISHAPKQTPLFAVQIESVLISQRPKSETEATGFWVAYISDNIKTLSPARMVMFLRITNLQEHPVMMTKYSVEMGKAKMTKISGSPTEAFYDGHGNIHSVCWINDSDLLDKNLEGLNLQPRVPVQGIALFDFPAESRPASLNESDLAAMRFTITIIDAEGRPFTSEPLQPKPDPSNETVQSRIVRFNRGTRDLSTFKIKDFTVSRGFTSPPF